MNQPIAGRRRTHTARRVASLLAGALLLATTVALMRTAATAATASSCQPPKNLTAGVNQNGRIELFATCNGHVVHRRQLEGYANWSSWQPLGNLDLGANAPYAKLFVARNADGRLELFEDLDYGPINHLSQVAPNGGWSQWQPFPSPGWGIDAIARNDDGRLEVFGEHEQSGGYNVHSWQLAPNSRTWSSWHVLTTDKQGIEAHLQSLAVGHNADGRLEVFGLPLVPDGSILHAWQEPGGGWSKVTDLPFGADIPVNRSLTAATNRDGRLELFTGGVAYEMCEPAFHIWQLAPNSGWSGWSRLTKGCNAGSTVAANADGRLEAFMQRWDDGIWPPQPPGPLSHLRQDAKNGWSAEAPMLTKPRPTGQVVVARNGAGLLEAFVPVGKAVWHASQLRPNSSGWSPWGPMS